MDTGNRDASFLFVHNMKPVDIRSATGGTRSDMEVLFGSFQKFLLQFFS